VLKDFYSHAKVVNEDKLLVEGVKYYKASELLSVPFLDNQQGFFNRTMKANCEVAFAPPFNINVVIKLWRNHSKSRHLYKLILEYFKLTEIGCCLVLGSVEDEGASLV
jgi:hypothetical protein